jgi:hypothetical protein
VLCCQVDYTLSTLARIHLGQQRSELAASDVPGARMRPLMPSE